MKKFFVSLIAATSIFLTGCGITVKQAAPYHQVVGTITDIQPATVEGKANLVGVGLGAVTGVALGNQVGKGRGRDAAKIAGAILGGMAGAGAQKKLTEEEGIRVTIVSFQNQTYQVVQAKDPSLEIGQTVRLMTNGTKGKIIK